MNPQWLNICELHPGSMVRVVGFRRVLKENEFDPTREWFFVVWNTKNHFDEGSIGAMFVDPFQICRMDFGFLDYAWFEVLK